MTTKSFHEDNLNSKSTISPYSFTIQTTFLPSFSLPQNRNFQKTTVNELKKVLSSVLLKPATISISKPVSKYQRITKIQRNQDYDYSNIGNLNKILKFK